VGEKIKKNKKGGRSRGSLPRAHLKQQLNTKRERVDPEEANSSGRKVASPEGGCLGRGERRSGQVN